MTNVVQLSTGIPTNGDATVQIGDGPRLTFEQVRAVLVAGGVPQDRAHMAAGLLLRGTAYPTLVQRTAQDVMNQFLVAEVKAQRDLLRDVLRKRLSPMRLQALDLLREWHGVKSLAEALDVSQQQANNVASALHTLGLVERQKLGTPHPDFARSPYMYRAVAAVIAE